MFPFAQEPPKAALDVIPIPPDVLEEFYQRLDVMETSGEDPEKNEALENYNFWMWVEST